MEDGTTQSSTVLDIEATRWRKTLAIVVIGLCCSIIYLSFAPNLFKIRRGSIPLQKPQLPSIAGFYHFSTIAGHWRNIVNEQMLLAHLSGLIDASLSIHVTGLGKIEDNKTIYDIFADQKFIYEYDTRIDRYEYPTLMKLEYYCLRNNQSLVWYAHSKGASHGDNHAAPWRDVLNYFVIDKWQYCHGLLSTTNYTTCGAMLTLDSFRQPGWNTYYAGNMWWAKCSHVNRLRRLEKIDQKDRYNAELYVTSEPDVGHFNCMYVDLGQPILLNRQNASCTINYPLWRIR